MRIGSPLQFLSVMLIGGLLGCFNQPLSAQPQNRIEGRIQTPPPGAIPESARVTLRLVTGSRISSTSTSGNGSFTFDRLASGKYVVTVEAEGFQSAEEQVEILGGFLHNVYNVVVQIHPQRSSGEPQRQQSPVVPAQALSIPKEAQKEMSRAEDLAARKDYRAAIDHLEKAVAAAPNYFQAFNNMGVYYYQSGDKEKAVRAFERAIDINPDAPDPHSNLGIIYLELSLPGEAIPHLERATRLNARSANLFYQLARAYIFQRQFERAEEPLRSALQLHPPVTHARYLLAHVLYELGKKAEAAVELRLYLKSNPKNRAELEGRLRQWEEEIKK